MVPITFFFCCFLCRLWGLQDLLHEAEISGRHLPGTKMPNCWKMRNINVPAVSLYDVAANPPLNSKHIFKVSMLHLNVRFVRSIIFMWVKFRIDDGWKADLHTSFIHLFLSEIIPPPFLFSGFKLFLWFARNVSRWWNTWRSLRP